MKKIVLILGIITCLCSLTACGKSEEEITPMITTEEAEKVGKNIVDMLNMFIEQQAKDQITDTLTLNAVESWEAALKDMGSYEKITGTEAEIGEKEAVISVSVEGSSHNAVVEIIAKLEAGTITFTSITTNVEYSFGEIMKKAALNTLLGMGTVFAVLILISLIISCFAFIPKIQEKLSKKPNKEEIKAVAVDNTIAQIIEKEELSDDYELVAVISAAIAASEGASSTDGFVVRSIKRAGNKWQTVGRV